MITNNKCTLVLASVTCLISSNLMAEGSFQAGLNQPLFDIAHTRGEPLYVDILASGEVINVSVCGEADTDDVDIRIYNSSNVLVASTSLTEGNVTCNDPFTSALTNPYRYPTGAADTYRIEMDNLDTDRLHRFDISVTPDAVTNPDPMQADGRLFAYNWSFDAGDYAIGNSTNANYFPLVPGGRAATNYVWKLDLNYFAGYEYQIIANPLGVDAPRSGYSVLLTGNSVMPLFPIYVSYPDVAQALPTEPPIISDFRFIDDAGQDLAISPSVTPGNQDAGQFEFTADVDGSYSIIIDTNQDGVFASGDKQLLGSVSNGVTETVAWDGSDAFGSSLPASTYRAQLEVRMGEYHFIAEDVETSGGTGNDGLTIYQALDNTTSADTRVYWDDATFLSGGTTLPDGALSSSVLGKHNWGTFSSDSLGNDAYIDTYTFGFSSRASTLAAIVNDDTLLTGSDGVIAVDPNFTAPGGSFSIDLTDADLNVMSGEQEQHYVVVSNNRTGEIEQVSITESSINSADFSTTFVTVANAATGTNNDGVMNAQVNDTLTVSYYDQLDSVGASVTRTANVSVTDGDGIPDVSDLDDDNDGIPDSFEGSGAVDTDGDGVVDSLDVDSDNDGIYDLHESGADAATLDTDNDGRIDPVNSFGSNGLADAVETSADSGSLNYNGGAPLDSDTDTIYDFRDLDSDNDGIPDVIEAGGDDPDNDGVVGSGVPVVDANGEALSGAGLLAPDTDGDNTPDFQDRDSDADGIDDVIEAGGTDGNNDGQVDGFTDANQDGFDDGIAASPLPLPDTDNDGTVDYVDHADTDRDGVIDVSDVDDDNDGIPDSQEGDTSVDTDADGIPDSIDLDSDNDGVFDLFESGVSSAATLDANNDGRIDAGNLVGMNGLANVVETAVDSGVLNYNAGVALNTDADSVANFRDLDSDNDGITDIVEVNGSDADNDGVVGSGTPSVDENGVALSGAGLSPLDRDADMVADLVDLDSDGDGVYDLIEAGGSDGNLDGRVDAFSDADLNGLDDTLAATPLPLTDTDADGVADYADLDSDNDGLSDTIESNGSDPNGDGRVGPSPQTVDVNGVFTGGVLSFVDTDMDGVFDHHDLDSDNDGIADVIESSANDGDGDGVLGTGTPVVNAQGVPNGGLLNPSDSDMDTIGDQKELDADDDGLFDIVEVVYTDANNDGRVDGFTDVNQDGFDDALYGTPLTPPDSDSDGLPDFQDDDDVDNDGVQDIADLDDDNDGIPDALEGNGITDSDADGIVDSIDLDSDNDGLFDVIESGASNAISLDADHDGRIDPSYAVGSNGLANVIETSAESGAVNYNNGVPLDTDLDGVADFRDRDSDNDSIPDVLEAGGVDDDGDGVLGAGVPAVNIQGLANGAGLIELDQDGDGLPDQRDVDSDNDGEFDLVEIGGNDADGNGEVDGFVDSNGDGFDDNAAASAISLQDANNDGIPDYKDGAAVTEQVIRTSLSGIGPINLTWLMSLVGLLVILRRRSGYMLLLAMLCSSKVWAESSPADFERRLYVGFGIGNSTMEPATGGTIYSVDDDGDLGNKLYLGIDVSQYLSAELSYADLGSVTLQPNGSIDYSVLAIDALYYFYADDRDSRLGWSSYIKAGLDTIDNSADIPFRKENSLQVSLGAGLEYAWDNGFAMRLDGESYGDDAALITIGLLYRFGHQSQSEPVVEVPVDTDADGVFDDQDRCAATLPGIVVDASGCEIDSDADGVVDSHDHCPDTIAATIVDESGCALDSDGDGVADSVDQCPGSSFAVQVDDTGCEVKLVKPLIDECAEAARRGDAGASRCAIFETSLQGVSFMTGSATLTESAKQALDKAARMLLESSSVRIEIQAHTDNQGKAASNQRLSERRARSVARYLETRGVAADRMQTRGFGETRPIESNDTKQGRANNRRVEFKILE